MKQKALTNAELAAREELKVNNDVLQLKEGSSQAEAFVRAAV